MDRRLFLRLGLGAAAVGAVVLLRDRVLWAPPSAEFIGQVQTTGWLPWAQSGVLAPTVEVDVGGRTVHALIDSGAQFSVIDRALADQVAVRSAFDMPVMAHGVGGEGQMGRGARMDLGLGPLRIEGLRAAVLNLGPLAGPDGLNTPLILGHDVLSRLVLHLDTDRRRLSLTLPGTYAPPPGLAPVATLRRGRALVSPVTVEGHPIEAVVDTGASSLLSLKRSVAEAAGLLDGRPISEGSSLVLGGVVAARIVRTRSVVFADQTYRGRPVSIFADAVAPGVPDALVGMAAFIGRRVAIDAGEGRMWASRPLDLTVG